MKITLNGKEVEAQQVGFGTIGEPWAEYQLDDGATLRIKTVVMKVFRTEERNPDGSTIYSFHSQFVVAVDEKNG